MLKSKVEIVVVGNIVKETIIRLKKIVGPVLGGPCAYTSLALAIAGVRTGIVTYCDDNYRKEIERELRLVDMEGIASYLYTTENHLLYIADEKNRVEYSKVCPVITYDMIPESYRAADVFLICPMNYEVDLQLIKRLAAENKTVITDLGGFGGTTSYNHFSVDTKRGKYLIQSLCQYSTIIKGSFDDMQYLLPNHSEDECLDYFLENGAKIAFITLGSRGVAYKEKGKQLKMLDAILQKPSVQMNLTGAGDVFTAGAIAALLIKSDEIGYAMQYGNAAASLVLEENGGCVEQRMPTDRMIRMRMEGKL